MYLSLRLLVASLAVATFAGSLPAAVEVVPSRIDASRIDDRNLFVLRGNTHPLARPEFDQGRAPADLPMSRMLLVLKRSDAQEASLKQLLDAQQDRTSAQYHKWLTPQAFGARFGPSRPTAPGFPFDDRKIFNFGFLAHPIGRVPGTAKILLLSSDEALHDMAASQDPMGGTISPRMSVYIGKSLRGLNLANVNHPSAFRSGNPCVSVHRFRMVKIEDESPAC